MRLTSFIKKPAGGAKARVSFAGQLVKESSDIFGKGNWADEE